MSASDYYIGANDEHGLNPPTAGKRTPIMPYLNRSIYENEFNKPAKIRFMIALLRCGFRVFDVKPEMQDTSISTRVARVNAQRVNLVVTFAYNAFGSGETFNNVTGLLTYYSATNRYATNSRILSEDVYLSILNNSTQKTGRGVSTLSIGMLDNVSCPSTLVEAGFMTNLVEARLMLDPDWVESISEATAVGICNNLSQEFIDGAALSNYPIIRRGSRGNYVRIAQYYLLLFGHNVTADGIFGANTETAVRSFQMFNGLTADGIIGRQTWAKLLLLNPESTVLSSGKNGSEVYFLQEKLNSKLYPTLVDGIFGSGTDTQVKAFQRESGLSADGVVGPLTWSKILSLNSPRTP